ncbi:MAG: hypothetical protein AAB645_01175 [Patescibacteria group bacterium]
MIILIWIAAISFIALTIMVMIRIAALRNGQAIIVEQSDLHLVVQTKIDDLAVLFVLICREMSKFLSLYVLVFLQRLVSLLKVEIIRVEKKFSRIIDAIKGKGETSKKGAVSFFLREIQDHKDRVKVKISL